MNDYLYNGKELQDELGMERYDYGARFYDPQIGRFTCLDPLADKFVWVNPYNYAENDPVGSIDLWGLQKLPFQVHLAMSNGNPIQAAGTYLVDRFSTNGLMKVAEGLQLKAENYVLHHTDNGYTQNVPQVDRNRYESQINLNATGKIIEGTAEYINQCLTIATVVTPIAADGLLGERVSQVVAKELGNVVPEGKLANHIFSNKAGKLIDSPANRELITDLTNSSENLLGVDKYGESWFSRTLDDGKQLYGYTQDGVVKGAGINNEPVDIIKTKGLK